MSDKSSKSNNNVWIISFRNLDVINNPDADSRHQEHYSNSAGEKETKQQNGNKRSSSVRYPEKLWVWISTFSIMLLAPGLSVGFGTLFVDIMEEYGTSRADTVVVQSLQIAICQLTGVISGIIVTRFGSRTTGIAGGITFALGLILSYFATEITLLYFTAGALPGFGWSLLHISITTVIGFHFSKRSRPLAFSLAFVASGVGGFVFSYFLRYLRETYGLLEAFLIVGGVTLNCLPFAVLLTVPTLAASIQDRGERDAKGVPSTTSQCQHKGRTLFQILLTASKNIPYILFVIAVVCCLQQLPVFYTVITDIYIQKGFSKTDGTLAVSFMNILSIVGRLAPAALMHIPRFNILYIPILCSAIGVIFMTSVNLTTSLTGTVAVTSGVGIYNGLLMTMVPLTAMSLIGRELYSTGVGLVYTLCGVFTLATTPLCGFVKDVTGSYELVLYGLSALIMCGFLLFCVVYWLRRKDVSGD